MVEERGGPIAQDEAAAEIACARRGAMGVFALIWAMHAVLWTCCWPAALMVGGAGPWRIGADWRSAVPWLAFAVAAPVLGCLAADRWSRPRTLALGLAVAVLAMVGPDLARASTSGLPCAVVAPALMAAGAAAFLVSALGLLMDEFPNRSRGRALAGFFVAAPLGGALRLALGRALATSAGWDAAFVAFGALGVALSLLALMLSDPLRGASEGVDADRLRLHQSAGASREDQIDLMVNSSYTYSVFGLAFAAFAIVTVLEGLVPFLVAVKGHARLSSVSIVGLAMLVSAVIGLVWGGWLVDRFAARRSKWAFVLPGLALFAAIGGTVALIAGRTAPMVLGGVCAVVALVCLEVAPGFAIVARVAMPNQRSLACGGALAAIALLGALGPPLVAGWLAQTFGAADSMATGFGQALAGLGALPVVPPGAVDPLNLTAGLLAAPPALIVAGTVLLAGARHLERESALMLARLRAAPRHSVRWPNGGGASPQ